MVYVLYGTELEILKSKLTVQTHINKHTMVLKRQNPRSSNTTVLQLELKLLPMFDARVTRFGVVPHSFNFLNKVSWR